MQIAGAVARAVRRRLSWETVGVALSLVIIAAACFTLFKLLRDVDIGKFGDAVFATPIHAVLGAGLLIAASYVCLTFYDFFALRTIGQTHVPYRIAALTGFLSYTIGHNLGAMVFTGGVVRFRIYRSWGLTLIDVAKVAFVTGLTFWLGNAVVLGVGIAYAPDVAGSINQLPSWINRTIALAALAAIAAYLIWLLPRPRVIGRDGWTLTLPSAVDVVADRNRDR
jgi:glycosyltransferase 2 family protein